MIRRSIQIVFALSLLFTLCELKAQDVTPAGAGVLQGVKSVQVDPTVVPNPSKIKETFAPNLVQSSLRNAFQSAGIKIAENAAVRAHVVLDEFSSGSTAKRALVGFGAGRSAVTCHLVLQDASGKELSNTKIRVRGSLVFSPYQGNNTQRRQAVSSLDQRFLEEIEKMK
jgi:Domain of unknown function (DUF4410)